MPPCFYASSCVIASLVGIDMIDQVFLLDTSRLYATYFGGDEKLGVGPDEDSKKIWLK